MKITYRPRGLIFLLMGVLVLAQCCNLMVVPKARRIKDEILAELRSTPAISVASEMPYEDGFKPTYTLAPTLTYASMPTTTPINIQQMYALLGQYGHEIMIFNYVVQLEGNWLSNTYRKGETPLEIAQRIKDNSHLQCKRWKFRDGAYIYPRERVERMPVEQIAGDIVLLNLGEVSNIYQEMPRGSRINTGPYIPVRPGYSNFFPALSAVQNFFEPPKTATHGSY